MSNFTKEKLYEIYTKILPNLGELQEISAKEDVSFEIEVSTTGRIELTCRDWTKDSKTLEKMYIRQTEDAITDGAETIRYE